jgi:hypothetical protein
MKERAFCLLFILFIISGLSAQMTVSGVLDSTVRVQAGAAVASDYSCGVEEFANIRFQSQIKERAAVFGAVNLFAVTGDYSAPAAALGYFGNENYVAGIELERLYFRLNGESVDFDGGLMRLPFGYGQVWGPSDFLNPSNPLKPDARPRAVLGAALSWFPNDDLKLLGFYAAPRDAFSDEGEGSFLGLSMDKHWEKASFQFLYSYEMPITDISRYGIHRAGFSLKADIEVGLTLEALYTYNHEAKTRIDGLSFCAGLDYSFFDGDLIVLAEYLYNGENSSTAFMINRHNLYTGFTWRFTDYTNLSIALISSYKDISYTPIVTLNHDLFQGATLTFLAQVPIVRNTVTDTWYKSFYGSARLRLRF